MLVYPLERELSNKFTKEEENFMKNLSKEGLFNNSSRIKSFDKFVMERIQENKNLFSNKELKFIKDNSTLIKKIYLLSLKNYSNII